MPRTYKKVCRLCRTEFIARSWDVKYCGVPCRTAAFRTGFAEYACGTATCKQCGQSFNKKHLRHAYCTPECKAAAQKARGPVPTEQQYTRISGDWHRYFTRLCAPAHRRLLTPALLYEVLVRQNYKCALTGVPLTCVLVKGARTWTNASIDRVAPGAPYTATNIRLACTRVNTLRGNMTDEEFVHWCKLVVLHSEIKDAP